MGHGQHDMPLFFGGFMESLLKPQIINLIVLKVAEDKTGPQVTPEQVTAVLKALIWMQQKLQK